MVPIRQGVVVMGWGWGGGGDGEQGGLLTARGWLIQALVWLTVFIELTYARTRAHINTHKLTNTNTPCPLPTTHTYSLTHARTQTHTHTHAHGRGTHARTHARI